MKRYFCFLLLCILSLASCVKEAEPAETTYNVVIDSPVYYAGSSEECCMRTLTEESSVCVVYGDGTIETIPLNLSETQSRIKTSSTDFVAFIPADKKFSFKKGNVSLIIPSDITEAEISGLYSAAIPEGNKLCFNTVCAVAKLHISQDDQFTGAVFYNNGGDLIAGTGLIKTSDLSLSGGSKKRITIHAESGTLKSGDYYIQFIPAKSSTVYTIELTAADGTTYQKSVDIDVAAGQALNFGNAEDWTSDNDRLSSANHPRLFMNDLAFENIQSRLSSDSNLKRLHDLIITLAASYLGSDALEFKLDVSNKRILEVSREAVSEIFSCAYAYRSKGEEIYLKHAIKQLDAVCSFDSWNPSHYLDVAEMCVAVGVGYDWLYDKLPVATKTKIVNAVKKYALSTALNNTYNKSFIKKATNWNQVCCGGLTVAALAVYEECPSEAQSVIDLCRNSNQKMASEIFSPDGNYPEGYTYWGYGCSFQAMMDYALETVAGYDNYSRISGISKTPLYYLHMEGPAGYNFCYSDTCPATFSIGLPMWYFAYRQNNPSLLINEYQKFLGAGYYDGTSPDDIRLLPLVLPWMASLNLSDLTPPSEKLYVGNGVTPVIAGRSSWSGLSNTTDAFFGFKGGKANTNHAHMDAGSFVFDAQNVRWAWDFVRSSYDVLEKAMADLGGNYWSTAQNSMRWTLNILNNKWHNTLTVNGADHVVSGNAVITSSINKPEEYGGTIDLSPVLAGNLASAKRTVSLRDGNTLFVIDSVIAASDKDAEIEWRMMTPAKATVRADGFVLEKDGKTEYVRFSASNDIVLTPSIFSTQKINSYDFNISSYTAIGFKSTVGKGQAVTFTTTISDKQ